jgi:hypothetical protein
MTTAICSALAGAALLAFAGAASAGEPVTLSDVQMDGVTASGAAIAAAAAQTFGDLISSTTAATSTNVNDNVFATATGRSMGVAASVFFLPARSASASRATAVLP